VNCGIFQRAMGLAAAFVVVGCQEYDSSKRRRTDDLDDTAWAVSYLTGTLLNDYIATQQAGIQDVTIPCSRGGTIRMTGNTAYDDATSLLTMDITYGFEGAHAAVAASNLVVTFHPLSGTIRQTGVMRLGGGVPREDHTAVSTGLLFDVSLEREPAPDSTVAGDGAYEMVIRTRTNGVGAVYRRLRGELDGAAFTWDYDVSVTNEVTNVTSITVIL
jgi:hypothetical protein